MSLKSDLNRLTPETINELLKVLQSESQGGKDSVPSWVDGNIVNDAKFAEYFLKNTPLKYVGGCFYGIDGIMDCEKITKNIINEIKPYVKTLLTKKAGQLLDAIRYEALCDSLPINEDRVHFRNGTYFLEGGFVSEKQFCANRIPIAYNPQAPYPASWHKFLNDLLYEEDIPTLQEYMGYMLIPSTKAQAMLMLLGSGGEGKSRIGVVCEHILGNNMNTGSVVKLSNDRFSAADQEGKLLLVDDDMKMEALTDTGKLKAIITMEGKMDLERKGKQSHQGYLYLRIMVFSNGSLSSLYDKSDGFYRRQIVIKVKEKPSDRIDDKNLSEKLIAEIDGIVLWCLEGLERLLKNGFHFTISNRSKRTLEEIRKDEDSILDFFESDGYIRFKRKAISTTKELYLTYSKWCEDNLIKPRSTNTFAKELKQRKEKLGLEYLSRATPGDKSLRGYEGIEVICDLGECPFY